MSAPSPGNSALTRETILRALDSLSEELGKQGVTGEIYPANGIPVKTQYLVEGLFEEGKPCHNPFPPFTFIWFSPPKSVGCSCATKPRAPRFTRISAVSQEYIAGQEEHHRQMSFEDELRALLHRHEIEWDEKYVWD